MTVLDRVNKVTIIDKTTQSVTSVAAISVPNSGGGDHGGRCGEEKGNGGKKERRERGLKTKVQPPDADWGEGPNVVAKVVVPPTAAEVKVHFWDAAAELIE
mmetsp:Transcript_54996/g.66238  ORF Transcript_54996/g.66238 Transcript_54996/m.66238 type:complete len:101 (+) Transcript_54996:240-542(+)